MRVSVIGATGRTGSAVVRQAQQRGHDVTAVGRDGARLEALRPQRIVVPERWDAASLAIGLDGADAVAFCIGPRRGESPTVQQDLIVPVVEAMRDHGVRRLVAISASGGVVDGDDPISRYVAKPLLARFLRDSNADMAAMEARIRESATDWTIVCPPRLTDGKGAGRYRSRRDGNVRWGYSIARSDLALAIVEALENPGDIGVTLSVAGGGRP